MGDIDTDNQMEIHKNKHNTIYFFRQMLINTGAMTSFIMLGLVIGTPTVLVPQLRQEANSTNAVTPEQASWLAALSGYSGLPWCIILPIIMAYCGRKIAHTVFNISSLIGFTMFYCSSEIRLILISQIFQGTIIGGTTTVTTLIVAEYTGKEYRGIFLTIQAATFFWGILIANVIGTFSYWKNIPLIGIVCSLYNLATVYFWPESPLWLADKGYYDRCTKAHRWLLGSTTSTEKELEKLIALNLSTKKNITLKSKTVNIIKSIRKKMFYKPVLLDTLVVLFYLFSGKLVCTVYAVEILKKITNNTSAAYTGMLIIDAVTILCMHLGSVLARRVKRRFFFFTSSSIGIMFLFILSLYLYLVKLSVVSEEVYVSLSLLVAFSVALGCGPMILTSCIASEILPIEPRSFTSCITKLVHVIVYGSYVKLAPYLFAHCGTHGTFFLYGLLSTICLILLYIYLPETKDKTLQEIADLIMGVKPVEEMKELLPIKTNNVTIVPTQVNKYYD